MGDFLGQVKALITDSLGGTTTVDIPQLNATDADGSLSFWGVIYGPNPMVSIKFFNVITSGAADAWGLDDLIAADLK